MSISSNPSDANITAILNIGYDLKTAHEYLKLCKNDLNKTIELLLIKKDTAMDVDMRILTNALDNNNNYKLDQSKEVIFHLKKYNDDENEIQRALKESNGNFSHARLLLKEDALFSDSE